MWLKSPVKGVSINVCMYVCINNHRSSGFRSNHWSFIATVLFRMVRNCRTTLIRQLQRYVCMYVCMYVYLPTLQLFFHGFLSTFSLSNMLLTTSANYLYWMNKDEFWLTIKWKTSKTRKLYLEHKINKKIYEKSPSN